MSRGQVAGSRQGCRVAELAPILRPAPACRSGWENAAVSDAFLGHAVASGQAVAWFLPSSGPAPNHWRAARETSLPPATSLLQGWISFGEVAS